MQLAAKASPWHGAGSVVSCWGCVRLPREELALWRAHGGSVSESAMKLLLSWAHGRCTARQNCNAEREGRVGGINFLLPSRPDILLHYSLVMSTPSLFMRTGRPTAPTFYRRVSDYCIGSFSSFWDLKDTSSTNQIRSAKRNENLNLSLSD